MFFKKKLGSRSLTIEGGTMDRIYESFAGQISGFGTKSAADTRRIIAIENEIGINQRLAEALQKKIHQTFGEMDNNAYILIR